MPSFTVCLLTTFQYNWLMTAALASIAAASNCFVSIDENASFRQKDIVEIFLP